MTWVHRYVLWGCVSSRFDSKRRRQDGVCSGNRFIWWRRSIEKSNFSTILHLDWIDTKWLKLAEELKRRASFYFPKDLGRFNWFLNPQMFLIYLVYGNCKCQRKEKKGAFLKGVPPRDEAWLFWKFLYVHRKDIFYDKLFLWSIN